MAQQLDKISDVTALIGAMVTRSRAAQSVLGKSDFASRCAALQAAADQIRTQTAAILEVNAKDVAACLLYTSPSPRDLSTSRMPSSA